MGIIYFIVEGNTDKALIEALLVKKFAFTEYHKIDEMPLALRCQVPKYPGDEGELEYKKRPVFLHKNATGIMIDCSGGKEGIAYSLLGRLKTLSFIERLNNELSIAVIFDRDLNADDEEAFRPIVDAVSKKGIEITNGKLSYEDQKLDFAYYVIPAKRTGAIETLLLEIAEEYHLELNHEAKKFKEAIESRQEFEQYRKEWCTKKEIRPLYAEKIQLGAVASVLKPDSSPAMMIKDKLFSKNNLDILSGMPEVARLIAFLDTVLKE